MVNAAAVDAPVPPALTLVAESATHRHFVQFYESDDVLCDHVARYLAGGLTAEEPAIVIATEPHRASIARCLGAIGHDLAALTARGQLAMLDAHATLETFMVGDAPSRVRFFESVGGALDRVRAGRGAKPVRAYGEMVDVLWRAGNRNAALSLEGLWNDLAKTRSFSLLCAYAMGNFYKAADCEEFDAVCAAHSHVIPGETHAAHGQPHERFREIAALQQRTRALEHENEQRKEIEAALREALLREREAREEAERSLRFNELFAGMLGHDLRNPLGTIAMGASHIARSSENERVARSATRIVTSAERMARMVDQLLDLTKLRIGSGFEIVRARTDLAELWQGAIDEVAAAHPGAAIAIESLGDAIGEWDRDRLTQVASNLVHNAVVHGARERSISVRIDGTAPATVVATVHNGGVVPAEILPVMFEPFRGIGQRVNARGLGLGLYIAQQIVAAHGGTIDVHSSETDGTTLRVCLPRCSQGEDERAE